MQARPPLHPLSHTHAHIYRGVIRVSDRMQAQPFCLFPFISHSFLLLPFVLHRHPEVLRASDKAPRGPKSYLTLTADHWQTVHKGSDTIRYTPNPSFPPFSILFSLFFAPSLALFPFFHSLHLCLFYFLFSSFFSRHKPISHTDCHLQIDVLLLMVHSVWNLWLTLVWNLRKRIRTTGGEKVDTSFFSFPNSESLNFDFNLFFLRIFEKKKKKVPSFFYFQWLQSSSVEICAALGKMFFSDCDITHFC